MCDDELIRVYVPPLVTQLASAERTKGSPLTEVEAVAIRDKSMSLKRKKSDVEKASMARGFADIDAGNIWREWNEIRVQFLQRKHTSRIERQHPTLGRLQLINQDAVWWQAKVEISPRHSVRFDLQVQKTWIGEDPEVIFEAGSRFVAWVRKAERRLREKLAELLLRGDYRVVDVDPDRSRKPQHTEIVSNLRLSQLVLFPNSTSDWTYDCGRMFGAETLGFMLGRNHKFTTPINLYGS
jgi:hypothetical protein